MRRVPSNPTSVVLVCCVVGVMIGCGSDDDRQTLPAKPTATASPTVTPTPAGPSHTENLFGSTAMGSGALAVDAAAQVEVFFSACLGGAGDTCAGGIVVYTATDPGFKEAEEDEPAEPLFVLRDGTSVSVEITAVDPAVSLKFDDLRIKTVGQSALLGTTPGVHRDLEWQLLLPGGTSSSEGHDISLKLTTTSSAYTQSATFTVTLKPANGASG